MSVKLCIRNANHSILSSSLATYHRFITGYHWLRLIDSFSCGSMAAASSILSSATSSFLLLLLLLYCYIIYLCSNVSIIRSKWINNANQLSSFNTEKSLSSYWQRSQPTCHLELGPSSKDSARIYKSLLHQETFSKT